MRKIVLSFFAAMCVLTAGSMVGEARAAGGGFDVCHKGQTITVGSTGAVSAHVNHGDTQGACNSGPTCTDTCEVRYQICLAGSGGDPEVTYGCELGQAACNVTCSGGPTCQDLCQQANDSCLTGAGGDAEIIAACGYQFSACSTVCSP